nr:MAG TPA: hypothetical protein [Caudoviricetes sp.]
MWYWGHTGLRRALIGRCVQKQHNRKNPQQPIASKGG